MCGWLLVPFPPAYKCTAPGSHFRSHPKASEAAISFLLLPSLTLASQPAASSPVSIAGVVARRERGEEEEEGNKMFIESFHVESLHVRYGLSEIESEYRYDTTELVHEGKDGACHWVICPKSVTYNFRTSTAVPKLVCISRPACPLIPPLGR
jgi:hypothetical protein